MTASTIYYGSNMMAAWIYPKGHSYKVIVSDRTGKKKVGCSFCRYQRIGNTMMKKLLRRRQCQMRISGMISWSVLFIYREKDGQMK